MTDGCQFKILYLMCYQIKMIFRIRNNLPGGLWTEINSPFTQFYHGIFVLMWTWNNSCECVIYEKNGVLKLNKHLGKNLKQNNTPCISFNCKCKLLWTYGIFCRVLFDDVTLCNAKRNLTWLRGAILCISCRVEFLFLSLVPVTANFFSHHFWS